ncbi:hypothetical protein PRZ48_011258 [Zasmidium cellare]|uniref:Uncharacterized protein n=1 Tax=Zasmidium cellare TaxID=395010 RepID=A0ABR0EB71_ZASCE|nr:hypothetical protein PRZ48_011258 [Zasmidium cellare]
MEAAGRTVMFVDVPKDRKDLRERFHPDNIPVWRFIRGEGDTFYEGGGFPITPEGRLKFNFRARKAIESAANDIRRISVPCTSQTGDSEGTVPLESLKLMKEVIGYEFPELAELGFSESRLCWCTDSIDEEFVIDYVPSYNDTLFVCSGDSGHGFKFLPNLGKASRNMHSLPRRR